MARPDPKRINNNRRFTRVEEFLVQREPEECTLGEAIEQHRLGLEILTILSLDDSPPPKKPPSLYHG